MRPHDLEQEPAPQLLGGRAFTHAAGSASTAEQRIRWDVETGPYDNRYFQSKVEQKSIGSMYVTVPRSVLNTSGDS
jgi:hypothetical protein